MDYITQPKLTTQPRLRVKEVTSELIMMHELFLRTKHQNDLGQIDIIVNLVQIASGLSYFILTIP